VLVTAAPDWADGVDDVPRSELAAGGDDGITDGTTSDTPTLLVNAWAALGVNSAISARALVEPPVRGGDNCIGVLVRDVARDEAQRRLSDFGLRGHGRGAPSRLTTKLRHSRRKTSDLE
jgi:hypothetical protein